MTLSNIAGFLTFGYVLCYFALMLYFYDVRVIFRYVFSNLCFSTALPRILFYILVLTTFETFSKKYLYNLLNN